MYTGKQMKERLAMLDVVGLSPKTPTYRCDICNKPFVSATALISHGQKVHGK